MRCGCASCPQLACIQEAAECSVSIASLFIALVVPAALL